VNQRPDSGEFFEGHSQAGLQMDSEKLASIRSANESRASGEQTGSDSESVLIRDIRGRKESIAPDGAGLRDGKFFAVKDVSFELRRGELRTLGQSEKAVSKKCLGATKVPDSGRNRHQCLGLIGHNGAGNQAAGQPLGRLPLAARRVRRRGKARINTTLLKMLDGLIKLGAGSITMWGRVGALTALGAAFPRRSALDAQLHFPTMAPCSGSRKPIEFFFINTNLKL
jgi:ABC-type polysaccharide/polyol phosphate transport system ATPase subunit